jgi:hypothetical protein
MLAEYSWAWYIVVRERVLVAAAVRNICNCREARGGRLNE